VKNKIGGYLETNVFSSDKDDSHYIYLVIGMAKECASHTEHGPFSAIIVKDNEIVGSGINHVTKNNDPTAHAEIIAIRDACKNLNTFVLKGCVIYSSAEPCLMCEGAIKWARLDRLVYSATAEDAQRGGFDDLVFKTSSTPHKILNRQEGSKVFDIWNNNNKSIKY